MRLPRTIGPAAAVALVCVPALAVINAGLQPVDLCRRYRAVIVGEVVAARAEAGSFEFAVTNVLKGEYAVGDRVTVTAGSDVMGEVAGAIRAGLLRRGAKVVAYAGKRGPRRHRNDLLFFTTTGFGVGEMASANEWRWEATDQQAMGVQLGGKAAEAVSTLAGTWNGSVEKLIELMEDTHAGRAYFPRKAYCRFKPDMLLDRFDESVKGVALYDINGDGLLDACACSEAGNRIYFRAAGEDGIAFANMTAYLKVADVGSRSCSFADVNADGWTDYLAGAEILRATREGDDIHFARTTLLPGGALGDVKSSAFVEIDGDGYPDVVASIPGGGLRVYLNPGVRGGEEFTDATEARGLAATECGAGLDGYFAPGDWNDDGRCDLFYAAGSGLLLVQGADGGFAPVDHDVAFSFDSGDERVPGLTGAGCFGAFVDPARPDLLVPFEKGWTLAGGAPRAPVDISRYGGEITEGSYLHLMTLAADLNADGYVDYYTTSRDESGHNRLILNRGYGMFMHALPHKYYAHVFQGPASRLGGWGAAAGDVDGDGADDLLVGNPRGHLVLMLNDTLAARATPGPYPTEDTKTLSGVRIATVRVSGEIGLVGACVVMVDAGGEVVARRELGSNVGVGCRGPNTVNLAVRAPGRYIVQVRFADGQAEAFEANLTDQTRITVDAMRDMGDPVETD